MKWFILSLLVSIFLMGFVSAEGNFTPVFCNDYEFTCCGGKIESRNTYDISDEESWTCPAYAHTCVILSVSDDDKFDWYVGSENCGLRSGTLSLGHVWKCDDEKEGEIYMEPNEQVYNRPSNDLTWGDHPATVEIQIIIEHLGFCGKSSQIGEDIHCGSTVKGSDGCKFSPNEGIIYTTDTYEKKSSTSYTVPFGECVFSFQSGNRRICGYKEESCKSDDDCKSYTFGNKECIGRTLQTYGCREYGTPIEEKDRFPEEKNYGSNTLEPTKSGDANFGKRCEIVKSETVQCCGDTDCGIEMFCNLETFVCEEGVRCERNSDCGVSVQCDWTEKKLKEPICENGLCDHKETTVECCSNENCQSGQYCSEDYRCVGNTESLSSEFGGKGAPITGQVTGGANGSFKIGYLLIFLALIIVGVGFYFFQKNRKTSTVEGIEPSGADDFLCPNCKTAIDGNRKFCTNCGENIEGLSDSIRCASCGKLNSKWRKFCVECGKKIKK